MFLPTNEVLQIMSATLGIVGLQSLAFYFIIKMVKGDIKSLWTEVGKAVHRTEYDKDMTAMETGLKEKVPFTYIQEEIKTTQHEMSEKLDKILQNQTQMLTRKEHREDLEIINKRLDKKVDKPA